MRPAGGGSPSGLGDWLVERQSTVVAVVVLALVVMVTAILPALGVDPYRLLPLPVALDSRPARMILAFVLLMLAVIAVAAGLKLMESRRAARWLPTQGVVVSSREGFRTVRAARGMPRNHRIADIVYEYTVTDAQGRPQRFRGGRIDIAETIPEEAVPDLLARYRAGTAVTVYHDPRDPSRAVLERGDDDGARTVRGLAAFAAILAVIALPLMWLVTNLETVVRGVNLNRWAGGAAVLGLAATVMLAVFVRQWREAREVRSWPSVSGRVTLSTVEVYDDGVRRERNGIRYVVNRYMPVIEYVYEVGGTRYVSRSIHRNTVRGGGERQAQALAARYPEGAAIEVRYDPRDPQSAVLEQGLGSNWSILAFGLVFAAGALFALTRA
jgi:hypothetical protein